MTSVSTQALFGDGTNTAKGVFLQLIQGQTPAVI